MGFAVSGLQRHSRGGLEETTLGFIPGDRCVGGEVPLGHGDLGSQGKSFGVGVCLPGLDARLEGLVGRRVVLVRESDLQGVVEVVGGLGQFTNDLLRDGEGLVRVGVGAASVTQGLGNRLNVFAPGNVEVDLVRELADNITGALRIGHTCGQHDDGRLVGGDLAELHGNLAAGALDLRGLAEGTLRGVLLLADTLRRGRVRHEVGVLLRVGIDGGAVKAPVRSLGNLVNDGGSGHGRGAGGNDDAPHNGLIRVAVFVVLQRQPAILLEARLAGDATNHVEHARGLATQVHGVLLVAGAAVLREAVGDHRAIPLGSRLNFGIEDDGDHAVAPPRSAANHDIVVRDDVEGAGHIGTLHLTPLRGLDDARVVREVVAGLHGALGLPR